MANVQGEASRLAQWFRRHGRALPWRKGHDPYHVLLAEFILQQTRMETGLRYFDRLVRNYPTVADLAHAPLSQVLADWSGLGYYSRARNLHATARIIRDEHGGTVPADPLVLESLPGIGPYTAGAIASIAYDRPVPSLDGNQMRVLGRLLGLRTTKGRRAASRIRGRAEALLDAGSPRVVNEALMDLGSLVCLPREPRCGACPLRLGCAWRRNPVQARRRARSLPRIENWKATIHRRRDAIWLAAPKARGLLANLWLPPMTRVVRPPPGPQLEHVFSHKTWRVGLRAGVGKPQRRGRWATMAQLATLPHSKLTRRLMQTALDAPQAPTKRKTPSGK